jgi:hypothetical protein
MTRDLGTDASSAAGRPPPGHIIVAARSACASHDQATQPSFRVTSAWTIHRPGCQLIVDADRLLAALSSSSNAVCMQSA